MSIALWIIQGLLAVTFIASGVNKLGRPRLALVRQIPYVEDFTDPQIKAIGAAELLGAIGLVVPPLVHVAAFLTPLAAAGLAVLMGGAVATHLRRNEAQSSVFNVVLLVLAAAVAIGRFGPYNF